MDFKIVDYSWVNLKRVCPIEINEITNYADHIESIINKQIDPTSLDKYKEELIVASGEIEIMISRLISLLYNTKMIKTELDKAIYFLLREDLSGYVSIIDEKQNKLLEVHDGEPNAGISRVTAFKKVLQVSLYGIIYNSINFASTEYYNFLKNKEIAKFESRERIFLRCLFRILSINLSVLGGLQRRKFITGSATRGMAYTPSLRDMFSQKGVDEIKGEYKEEYNKDIDINEKEDVLVFSDDTEPE